MNMSIWSKKLLRIAGIPVALALILYLIWSIWTGWDFADIVAGVGLVLVLGAMYYLQRMDIISERDITQRIRAEYPPESQPQIFEMYKHLKIKELEYLFAKILDDAHGNLNEVKKLTGLAESIGWKAFLENRW
jgi:hypothetical protein